MRAVTGRDRVGDLRLVSHDGDLVTFATPDGELAARVESRPGPAVPVELRRRPGADGRLDRPAIESAA